MPFSVHSRAVDESDLDRLRYHGDQATGPDLLDFAVNVAAAGPPPWLRDRLAARLHTLGAYPSAAEDRETREVVAARHGRHPDEILLLAGGAEGFALLPRLAPRLTAMIHPSFTEPEFALREAGLPVARVLLEPPYRLAGARVPDAADLVVLGNPTNPTSVLHPAADVLALRRPGRLILVDEAFADTVPGEPESVAGRRLPDVLVLRSLTKTWSLAGLRCGYLIGPVGLLDRLRVGRAHWPLGSLQLAAIRACSEPVAVVEAAGWAVTLAAHRAAMADRLVAAGAAVHLPAAASFLLLHLPDAERVREQLRTQGIAVRRGDTFPGLGRSHLRVAVRPPDQVDALLAALDRIRAYADRS
ncbi:Rv2231c family pyridoxal phosphate-dependent protein CobC [Skermania piniformis]